MSVSYNVLSVDAKNGTFVVQYDGLQPLNFFIPNDGTKFLTGVELEEAMQTMFPGLPAPSPFENFPNAAEIEALAPAPVEAPAPDAREVEANLRLQRDNLLKASDWTQIDDAPLTAEQKAAWAVYRQALRDVPAQAGFPDAIDWPIAPV